MEWSVKKENEMKSNKGKLGRKIEWRVKLFGLRKKNEKFVIDVIDL